MRLVRRNKEANLVRARQSGFTLIEVMVVAAIVAILAAVAYPSYLESVRKAKRAEGRKALMQLMQQQERYYSQNSKYIAFSSESTNENERKFIWFSGSSAAGSAYEIHATACGNEAFEKIENCVLLTARPGTSKVDTGYKDAKCENLTLASTGIKGSSTGSTDCWQ